MKLFCRLVLLLFISLPALGQGNGYVTVQGTLPGWGGGTVTSYFVNQNTSPQLPLLNGSTFPQNAITTINSYGFFTYTMADNGQITPTPSAWNFTLCAKAGSNIPCFQLSMPLPITCTTGVYTNPPPCVDHGYQGTNGIVDLTAYLSVAPPLPYATACQSPVVGIENGFACPTTAWQNSVGVTQQIADTTLTLGSAPAANFPFSGCFVVDQEVECWMARVGSVLLGITRGGPPYPSTPQVHNAGTGILSINMVMGGELDPPFAAVVGPGGSNSQLLAINAQNAIDGHGGASVLQINPFGNNEIWFDNSGHIHQLNPSGGDFGPNQFLAPVVIGTNSQDPGIGNSYQVLQTDVQNQASVPLGIPQLAGPVSSVQPAAIGAPSIDNHAGSGSTTYTYGCSGVDVDGNMIPGSTTTFTGPSSMSFPTSFINVHCPLASGIVTFNIWRLAGCSTQGIIASNTGQLASSFDACFATTPGTFPAANTSVPKLCIGDPGTPEEWCVLRTSGPPTGACTNGWWDSNLSNTPATVYLCQGNAWVPLSTPSGATGTYTNPSSVTVSNGIVTAAASGPFVQYLTITAGICSTPNTAAATCNFAVTWPAAFANTAYAVGCSSAVPTAGAGAPALNVYADTKTTTGFTVTLQNGQGSSTEITTTPEVDCWGVGAHP